MKQFNNLEHPPSSLSKLQRLFWWLVVCLLVSMTFTTLIMNRVQQNQHNIRRLMDRKARERYFFRKIYHNADPGLETLNSSSKDILHKPDTTTFDNQNGSFVNRLPDAIIIGASKCGTRALLEYIGIHPSVVIAPEEVNFFQNDTFYRQGLTEYRKSMPPSRPDQITLEKSPDYLECEKCPERIKAMNESIKLLLVLCDPVKRLISEYMQLRRKHSEDKNYPDFEKWAIHPNTKEVDLRVRSVRNGMYVNFLPNWFKHIPQNQFHIIDGGRFLSKPFDEMVKVEKFLGIKPKLSPQDFYFNETKGFFCIRKRVEWGQSPCLGPTKGIKKHIDVDEEVSQKLYDFYSVHNVRLKNLIGVFMSWY